MIVVEKNLLITSKAQQAHGPGPKLRTIIKTTLLPAALLPSRSHPLTYSLVLSRHCFTLFIYTGLILTSENLMKSWHPLT